jgi:CYTH domain-containing protein
MAMVQTYLERKEPEVERRVRSITEDGVTVYIYTEKRPRAYLSRFEDESEVSQEEYERLRKEDGYSELVKTRYAFPFAGHTMEIDVYPPEIGGEIFKGYAILQVEMDTPDEAVEFPEFLEIVREVTDEKRYHNKTLAKLIAKSE